MTELSPEERELLGTYGPLFRFGQYKIGDTIKYRIDGFTYHGEVLWCQAPGEQGGVQLPMRYVVHCDKRGFVDIVFVTDLVRDE